MSDFDFKRASLVGIRLHLSDMAKRAKGGEFEARAAANLSEFDRVVLAAFDRSIASASPCHRYLFELKRRHYVKFMERGRESRLLTALVACGLIASLFAFLYVMR